MKISWPMLPLPPINLHTVPLLEQQKKQTGNRMNPEGERKKVLFVCAQGRLRSATAMHLMNQMYGYNTRCCGVDEAALVPINQQLILWADEVHVMEEELVPRVQEVVDSHRPNLEIRIMGIPDEYEYMDSELCSLVQRRFFS